MKQMRSIMKDKFNINTNKNVSINIDPTKSPEFNLRKFVRYVQKTQDEIKGEDLAQALQGAGFFTDIESSKLPEEIADYEDVRDAHVFKYNDSVHNTDEGLGVYLVLNPNNDYTNSKMKSLIYFRSSPQYKMRWYNLAKFVACGKLMTVLTDEDYYTYYRELMGKELSEGDLKILKASVFSGLILGSLKEYGIERGINKILYTKLQNLYAQELNVRSMVQYAHDTGKDYAKAFQTKKNIPKKVQEAMAQSGFKKYGFKFVEYDADTDLTKVARVEKDWAKLYQQLPKSKQALDLRFRKLGNYRAWGVYFPTYNCMAVDLRAIDSFVHEYAHHLDFTYQDEPLSLTEEFLPIILQYTKNYDKLGLGESRAVDMYYKTPTEIFARAYEVYLTGHKKCQSVLLKESKRYTTEPPYKVITHDEELLHLVYEYFDTVFSK